MTHTHPYKVLNQLLILHDRSLAVYLSDAVPWMRDENCKAANVLRNIASDHRRLVKRIGQILLADHHTVDLGGFPIEFADLHDLSIDFLLEKLIVHQQFILRSIRGYAERLKDWPPGRALAEEALGNAQGHLEALKELTQEPSEI